MKRREPFFKKSHHDWYVELDRKQIRLGTTEEEAFARYHELMAARKKAERFVTPGEPCPVALGELLDRFLTSGFRGKSDETRRWYRDKLTPFVEHLGRPFTSSELRPLHVEQWAAAHPDWSAGTVRNLWRAAQRLYRWGHRLGLVPELAILHQEKPKAGRREVVISPEQYAELLAHVRNEEFRTLVVVAWETGARPQELVAARVRHLDASNKRLVFPPHESKDRDHPRVIYLTDTAFELLRPNGASGPETHLLRNSEGRPWTADASLCAFVALHKRMTRAGVVTRKYCLYHFRHSWLDRMHKNGVDVLTCAILMGHRDPSMIAKTYQHLSQSPAYLRAALNKAAG
ncbi:MAG: tyrosine-type recombinase/integrase [Gemmataceae bacterium]